MASKRLLVSGLALLLSTGVARAQSNDAQKETARSLMAEARRLRAEGDLLGALRRFNAADAIMNVPTTGFELASTQAQLGELVEARETLLRVLALPQRPNDPAPFNEARERARALDEQLAVRIGSITLQDCGVSQTAPLELSIDGKALPRSMIGLPFRANPGKHEIAARVAGRELWRQVDVAEGQAVEVALECAAEAPQPVSKPAASGEHRGHASRHVRTEPPAAQRRTGERPVRAGNGPPVLAYVGAGVGLLGIGLGTASGLLAISHKNAAFQNCVKTACPRSTWGDLDKAEQLATLSTVSFAVGGLGAVLAAGSLLLARPSSSAQSAWVLSPDVGRKSAELQFTGKF